MTHAGELAKGDAAKVHSSSQVPMATAISLSILTRHISILGESSIELLERSVVGQETVKSPTRELFARFAFLGGKPLRIRESAPEGLQVVSNKLSSELGMTGVKP
jgi:hypothetical protein